MKDKSRYDYEERAAEQDRNDYWGQVRRTINGKPVGEDQIELITDAVEKGLGLRNDDRVIDIGCGNGALTYRFLDKVDRILGIDRSEFLISVAKESFQRENIEYIVGDALNVLKACPSLGEYNKVLLYGVFSFFDDDTSDKFFDFITNATSVEKMFFGNVRDKSLAEKFYKRKVGDDELSDNRSSMGIWRSREYFYEISRKHRWKVEFSKMPKEFYANEYYFDVIMYR